MNPKTFGTVSTLSLIASEGTRSDPGGGGNRKARGVTLYDVFHPSGRFGIALLTLPHKMEIMAMALDSEISTKDAAEIIGCTEGYVRFLLIQGTLEGRKFNERAWAVDRESAVEFAKNPKKTGRPRSAG